MDTVNKIAAVGIVFFCVVLAGFIGARIDQTTIALLGGTFIALVVAVPAVALIAWMVFQRRATEWPEPRQYTPPPAVQPPAMTHNTTHHHYNITVQVGPGATQRDVIDAVVDVLPPGATAFDARQMVLEGRVHVVPMLPSGSGK